LTPEQLAETRYLLHRMSTYAAQDDDLKAHLLLDDVLTLFEALNPKRRTDEYRAHYKHLIRSEDSFQSWGTADITHLTN